MKHGQLLTFSKQNNNKKFMKHGQFQCDAKNEVLPAKCDF